MSDRDSEERIWMARLAEGDWRSFQLLFARYYPKVRVFLYNLLKNWDDADDVAQEIFAKVWVRRDAFATVHNFRTYLFVLSKNMAFNYIETQSIQKKYENDVIFDEKEDLSPYEELVAKDMRILIDLAVEQMPPQRRLVYELSRKAGLSNAEIAERLRLSKKTVENYINAALKELRKVVSFLLIFLFWGIR